MINVLIETDRVQLLDGDPQPVSVPRGRAAKQKIWRCPACQIALYSQYTSARIRFVRAGTLDDPASVEPERPHLYAVEAAVGDDSRVRAGIQHVLRHEEAVAGGEPRAARLTRTFRKGRVSDLHARLLLPAPEGHESPWGLRVPGRPVGGTSGRRRSLSPTESAQDALERGAIRRLAVRGRHELDWQVERRSEPFDDILARHMRATADEARRRTSPRLDQGPSERACPRECRTGRVVTADVLQTSRRRYTASRGTRAESRSWLACTRDGRTGGVCASFS